MTNPLNMQSQDKQAWRIEQLKELFPHCVSEHRDAEGKLGHHVDFERLRDELASQLIEPREERYNFTWPGKTEAIQLASEPINKTLRPCKEESVDFAQTENVYIEGDNLEVLKLLQETYLGKVKMIYIDPPYNTGNDFVYDDDFSMSEEEWKESSGEYNEFGHKLVRNTEANGRFHTDWLNMIYPRLKLAKDLLREDGVIFISIDDNEVHNLRKVCDEIFGEQNFVAQLIWQNKKGGGNDSKHIAIEHEYIMVYSKNKVMLVDFYCNYDEKYVTRYKECDEVGRYFWDSFKRKSGKQYYPITCPDGTTLEYDEDGNKISWLRTKSRFLADLESGDIQFFNANNKWSVRFKQRLPEGKKPRSIFKEDLVLADKGTTSSGGVDLYGYFRKDVFSNPKPVSLISHLLEFGLLAEDVILDFFSGSGTVAEAVMQLNAKDQIKRKYIAVQLPEMISLKHAAGTNAKRIAENAIDLLNELERPLNIAELAKERIRRAAAKIKEEQGMLADASLDLGFRVYKLADSNMKDVFYLPKELQQQDLLASVDNIKEDRSGLDLLVQVMLDLGLPLSSPIEERDMLGKRVYLVGDACELAACFDDGMDDALVQAIAALKPFHFVRRDAALHHDTLASNIEQIFEAMSPETKRSIL